MLDITKLFCSIDDFWKTFKIHWYKKLLIYKSFRKPNSYLSMSEIMTIMVLFHQSNFRTFKHFYFYLLANYSKEFPKLSSYPRFVAIQKFSFSPLFAYLHHCKGKVTGIAFIDSTVIFEYLSFMS